MHINDLGIALAATDLARHLACGHLIELERAAAEGRIPRSERRDPALDLLIRRGIEHEKTYVDSLTESGLEVVDLREFDGETALERTAAAMRQGAGVIVQAAVADGRWSGRADVLLRVDSPSDLGPWSYEVVDTKLARETRGGTVLQLCVYTDLVGRLQGRTPSQMHVVKPGPELETESFRFANFHAYYRLLQQRLEARVDADPDASTYPDPVPHCDVCPWWVGCDRRRRDDDHLSLVAGMQSLHIGELQRQGITTLEGFAERGTPLDQRPERGSRETFERLHGQAKIQLAGRRAEAPRYRLLPFEPERGFARLPERSPGDLFFDIESDPFVGHSGLEYLFGYVLLDADGAPVYRAAWAMNDIEEKRQFESFVDMLMERWRAHPGMHIYHFSPYEPGALKRLMGRHATREDDVDRLLRGERFVDLLAVTRQGLQASVEGYALKNLEEFFGFERAVELREAAAALRRVDCALELDVPDEIENDTRNAVEAYNRDDCLSTLRLREWLEERRTELIESRVEVPRPEHGNGDASEQIEQRRAEVQEVYDQLVDGLPENREAWGEVDHARWLLANLLDYFRREAKCVWWDMFRINDLDHDDLLDERKAVSGLRFVGEVDGGTARCPVHRHEFPEQEAAVDPGDKLQEIGDRATMGTVHAIDHSTRTIDIKRTQASRDHHPVAMMVDQYVGAGVPEHALLELARSAAENGVDGDGPFRAARDLLLRREPRLGSITRGETLRRQGEAAVESAVRLVGDLDSGVLPIQGPPGSGKTFTGAQMIALLAGQGKRIGVTAVGHKVIRKLLEDAIKAGEELGVNVQATHKPGRDAEEPGEGLEHARSNAAAIAKLDEGRVVGGTCWLWASDDAAQQLDYLFVDEAGQLSLAMTLAAGRSARNLVLLGDPQQLEQPRQGAHPEGADVSALEHILGEVQTIPADRGLFLDRTWRLHPAICEFTSEVYYDGRLEAREGLHVQALDGATRFRGSGLFFVSVEHQGNQNCSAEEVDAVSRIVAELLDGTSWINSAGERSELRAADILIVAPYNAQVGRLIAALPGGVRVGTVDKFQGQEAPVVIYSMTSSSAEDAPRGMKFLYDPHRLNVATSRARCVSIVIGSKRLLEPRCRTPEQITWANALCRISELSGSGRRSG